MDVTPHELRTIELREAWRGYRQDDVDELLDRVATTIEGLQGQVQRLSDRLARAEEEVGLGKEADEMLRRTLLLAQRTADAAVSEAQERARRLVSEAEAKATTLVTGAEEESRRLSLHERRRVEGEIRDLARRRDALTADVDALEKFASDHRRRVREFLEGELAGLEERSVPEVPPRPVLSEVELPDEPVAEAAPVVAEEPVAPEMPEEPVAEAAPVVAEEPVAEEPVPATEGMSLEALYAEMTASEEPADPGPPPSPADLLPQPPAGPGPQPEADPAPIVDYDDLDDDQYLAELRRAVEDDTPLGPRDDEPGDHLSASGAADLVAAPADDVDVAEMAEVADVAEAAEGSGDAAWSAEPDEWVAADRAVLFDQDADDRGPATGEHPAGAGGRSVFRRRG